MSANDKIRKCSPFYSFFFLVSHSSLHVFHDPKNAVHCFYHFVLLKAKRTLALQKKKKKKKKEFLQFVINDGYIFLDLYLNKKDFVLLFFSNERRKGSC